MFGPTLAAHGQFDISSPVLSRTAACAITASYRRKMCRVYPVNRLDGGVVLQSLARFGAICKRAVYGNIGGGNSLCHPRMRGRMKDHPW